MEFNLITSGDDYRAQQIFESYSTAFPEDERRNEAQFGALFHQPQVKIFSILENLENVGYVIAWELSNFTFLEHFEIFPEFRSRNLGSQVLSQLSSKYSRIVLESEPPNLNETAARRIGFYTKNGFAAIDENYVQPSYEAGKNSIQLWLLANFAPENTARIREEIYDVVYCK